MALALITSALGADDMDESIRNSAALPILNNLINLTSEDITVAGVTLQKSATPLALVPAPLAMSMKARIKTNTEDRDETVWVFAPPEKSTWRRPLPPLPTHKVGGTGVIVTRAVALALTAHGTPYKDEDEEKTARAKLPVYVVEDDTVMFYGRIL